MLGLRPPSSRATGRRSTGLDLLGLDDHQVVPVVVAEEEQERHRAVAAHRLGIDVHSLGFELRLYARGVARVEHQRDAQGILYRPGVPQPDTYVRVDYALPLGFDDRREGGVDQQTAQLVGAYITTIE